MGILGAIWNGVKSAATAVASGVKAVASKVASFFSGSKETVRESARDIGERDGFDPEKASARDTNEITAILSNLSMKYMNQARDLEDDAVDIIENYFEGILEELDENGFDTGFIKDEKKKIRRKIRGSITSKISERMSISDSECYDIISMESGSRKTRAMEEFGFEVLDEAMNRLGEKIKRSCKSIEDKINESVIKKIEETELELENKTEETKNLIRQLEDGTLDSEAGSIEPTSNIYACSCALDILS